MRTAPGNASRPAGRAGVAPIVLVGLIFAVSGATALIYQVSWQRILALHTGVGVYSVAMIVAAFLAGLGLGHFWGGRISLRLRPVAALRRFGILEIGIGLFALASIYLYHDLFRQHASWLYASPVRAGLVHFLSLLVPTVPMGMSLPLVAGAIVHRTSASGRTLGFLYGVNVLGAAAGAMAAPWLLIRFYGIDGAVRLSSALNLAVGAAALVISLAPWFRRRPTPQPDRPVHPSLEPAGTRPLRLWLLLYGLSGFCALSLEIVWFRIMNVAVKATAFTFGTVLAIYLLGLGLGSLVGGPMAVRIRRPLRAFLLCQSLLLLYSGAAVSLLILVPPDWPLYGTLMEYWKGWDQFLIGEDWNGNMIASLYVALPLTLYGLPTFLMGLSFPILQRAVQDDLRSVGFRVGLLQAGNITGNVAGSLVTGLLLLHLAGTAGTLRLLMGTGLFFALLGMWYDRRRTWFALIGGALLAVLVLVPDGHALWTRLHGATGGSSWVSEDASSVVVITPEEEKLRVSVNGTGHSWLPFGGVHSLMGAIPAAIHPTPRHIAIIGLGSGDTAWAAAFRSETEQVTVFEISTPQQVLLREVALRGMAPGLQEFLTDKRFRIVQADGRNELAGGDSRFDLIEADALRPHSAYSGNLYSVEFFRLCARRLRPGGMMCTWAPTLRVHRAFGEVFPHVLEFGEGQILVGSLDPFPTRKRDWYRRIADREARRYLGDAITSWAARELRSGKRGRRVSGGVAPNRDLFPRDEFLTPSERDRIDPGLSGSTIPSSR